MGYLFTGQWQNLHHRSNRVTGWEHAGHCWSFAVDLPAAGRDGAVLRERGGFTLLRGAPGSLMWQCGQCSGPGVIVRRHSGHVTGDTFNSPGR